MTGDLPSLPTPPSASTSFSHPSEPLQLLSTSGIIPRVLSHIFSSFHSLKSEFTVRVSFLEIYNEELRDLNGPISSDKQLRIFEDSKKKGNVLVQGLEETLIGSELEGLSILNKGLERRETSATNCNSHSSRSHTIFSLTIHLTSKSDSTGEQLLKVGRLNLVDLAGKSFPRLLFILLLSNSYRLGSENVGRSGVEKGIRTREAGMINQSLLTLGRVIGALVEGGHVPYRESKLTRLLSPSLGGSTKTLLLSTISPSLSNVEETLSTLDYSLRAKSIKNKPERNERMKKNELLSTYAMEIERLKLELWNQREKAGIYISQERWEELTMAEEALKTELEDLKVKLIGLEEVIRLKDKNEKELT
jgi:kinesin family member 11